MKHRFIAALTALMLIPGVQAATEQSVRDNLMKSTGLKAEAVRPAPVKGLWEVVIQDRIFYVDDDVKVVFSGSLIDTATKTNLTQERLREVARDNWKKWPFEDAVKQVFGKGEREVIVFSDANCTYCRMMEDPFAAAGNLTGYTFIVPMLRGETNNREIVCSKDPAEAWHNWMARGIAPAPAPEGCDASVLQRNARLMSRYNITGAPTLFFPSGDRMTGAMTPEQLESRLQR